MNIIHFYLLKVVVYTRGLLDSVAIRLVNGMVRKAHKKAYRNCVCLFCCPETSKNPSPRDTLTFTDDEPTIPGFRIEDYINVNSPSDKNLN
jgi:hypothetical protein